MEPAQSTPQDLLQTHIQPKSAVLTDRQLEWFLIINFATLCTAIALFGIVANVTNIIIFFKQGFTNTVNISLFGLAISDLASLISVIWTGLCLNPSVTIFDVPWVPLEFQYITGAWPHITCGRITSYITVYVTAERCLCILSPMKIKQIVTPARTTIAICLIFLLNIFTLLPEYATSYLEWKFFPDRNATLLSITYRSGRDKVATLVFIFCSVTGLGSFLALIAFTVILVVKLKQSSEWRKEATSGSGKLESVTSREKKTVKMIVVIATILIACYAPGTMLTMTTFLEPEFYLFGRYYRLASALWSLCFVLNAINSSVNIFLYYNMSSNYRLAFDMLYGSCKNALTPRV